MVYSQAPGQTVIPSVPAGTVRSFEVAPAQRINQFQNLEERLRNGVCPAVVAGMTALLAQTEAQQTLPTVAVSIVADVSEYKRIMTYRNGMWDGFYLTRQFQDDRSTTMFGSTHTVFEQEASLHILPCVPVQPADPQMSQPAQMTIQPYQPQPQQYVLL